MALLDQFTDTNGVLLENHTPTGSGAWTKHVSSSTTAQIANNRVRTTINNEALYWHDWTPATAEYDVECDLYFAGTLGDNSGPAGRIDTTANKYYYSARHSRGSTRWELIRNGPAGFTTLATSTATLTETQTYHIKLEIRDASKKIYIDGSETALLTSADNNVTAAGKAGFRMFGSNASAPLDSKGYHLDDFATSNVGGTDATGTVTAGTLPVTGTTATGTAGQSATGAITAGQVPFTGTTATGTAGEADTGTVAVGTLPITGTATTATAGESAEATVVAGQLPFVDTATDGSAGQSASGTVAAGTVPFTGTSAEGTAGESDTGTVAAGVLPFTGTSASGSAGQDDTGTVGAGTLPFTGTTVAGSPEAGVDATGTVNAGTLPFVGSDITSLSLVTIITSPVRSATLAAKTRTTELEAEPRSTDLAAPSGIRRP